jgi:hypothetical protein
MNNCCDTNRMRKMRGLEMCTAKGGNDPASGCRARKYGLVVPALWLPKLEHNRITNRSVQNLERIKLLMSEWSNNDKNYVVNQLLRFTLCAILGRGVPGLQGIAESTPSRTTNGIGGCEKRLSLRQSGHYCPMHRPASKSTRFISAVSLAAI